MRTVTRWAGLSGQPMNRFSEHAGERAQDASRVVDQKSRVRSGYFGLLVAHDTLTSQPRWISTETLQRSRSEKPIRLSSSGFSEGKRVSNSRFNNKRELWTVPLLDTFWHSLQMPKWRVSLANYGEAIAAMD